MISPEAGSSAAPSITSRHRSGSVSTGADSIGSYDAVTIVPLQSYNNSISKVTISCDTSAEEETPLLARSNRGTQNQLWDAGMKEAGVLLRYALPIVSTGLLKYSFSVTSVVAIGHLSTEKLAGAALGNITAGVTGLSIIQGFVCALDSLLPQTWTGEHPSHVGLWTQRMLILTMMLIIPITAAWLNAEHMLLHLRQDPEVARLAALYLKYAALQLPGYAFNAIIRRFFQAQGLMYVPSIITVVIAPLNIALNYLLVWGPEPINFGFIGAPIATSISVTLMSLLYMIYGVFFAPHTAWHPITSQSFACLPKLLTMGLVGAGQMATEWWSWELASLAASQLGSATLAAQSILVVAACSSFQVPYSLGIASAVRVGNHLGSRNAAGALIASRAAMGLAMLGSLVLSSFYFALKSRLAYLFSSDENVAKLVSGVVPLLAAYQMVEGIAAVAGAILRACGKLGTGAISNLIGFYFIGIPLGVYLAFSCHLGLMGLWIGLAVALTFSAIVLWVTILRLDWDIQVREAKERVEIREPKPEENAHA